MFLTLGEIKDAMGSVGATDIEMASGVSTDTRTIKRGDLFVALRGERFDGRLYVADAFAKGAVAAVVDTAMGPFEDRSLIVTDTLVAYGRIASAWRQKFQIPVVAITGSVGKTTMKEMVALTLSPLGNVLKSEKNENNEVGVPRTLLRLSSDCESAVIEMGMRGFGQIQYLADIARPTIGVITLIGESHMELVGDRAGIANAKGELLEALSADNTAVLNADDEFVDFLRNKTAAKVISYGVSRDADVRVEDFAPDGSGWNFQLRMGVMRVPLRIESPAWHDVINAAGACAAAVAAGVDLSAAAAALKKYRPFEMRMELLSSRSGATIINDCYNAAPSSVVSALQTLSAFPRDGAKVAVLGDMRELGIHADQLHSQVAVAARERGIREVYAVGELMPKAFPDARRTFRFSAEAAEYLSSELKLHPADVVLVKGSRAMEMEAVVKTLVEL